MAKSAENDRKRHFPVAAVFAHWSGQRNLIILRAGNPRSADSNSESGTLLSTERSSLVLTLRVGAASQALGPEGRLFVETSHGRDAFLTLRGLGDQGRWSYGFTILDSETGTWEGQPIRRLKQIQIHEVSPVLLPAQPRSSTNWLKGQPLTAQQRGLQNIRRDFARRELHRVRMQLVGIRELEAIRDNVMRIRR